MQVTPSKVAKHEEFELRVRFTNPLHENLTNASIHVEASSIVKSLHIKCRSVTWANSRECEHSAHKLGGWRRILKLEPGKQREGVQ